VRWRARLTFNGTPREAGESPATQARSVRRRQPTYRARCPGSSDPNSIHPKQMAKGYWITFYHSVRDPARLAEYGALAVPAIEAGGGRFLSRGPAARTFEGVEKQRTVLVEFDSVARAVQTYQSPQYQAALVLLKGAVERDVRIVEGVG